MSNTTFVLAVAAGVFAVLLGIVVTVMMVEQCGWSVLFLGKQAMAAWVLGFCSEATP